MYCFWINIPQNSKSFFFLTCMYYVGISFPFFLQIRFGYQHHRLPQHFASMAHDLHGTNWTFLLYSPHMLFFSIMIKKHLFLATCLTVTVIVLQLFASNTRWMHRMSAKYFGRLLFIISCAQLSKWSRPVMYHSRYHYIVDGDSREVPLDTEVHVKKFVFGYTVCFEGMQIL